MISLTNFFIKVNFYIICYCIHEKVKNKIENNNIYKCRPCLYIIQNNNYIVSIGMINYI